MSLNKVMTGFFLLFCVLITYAVPIKKKTNSQKKSSLTSYTRQPTKTITVLGTGYVGLVSGAGLADFGNYVICADIDRSKIDMLNKGIIPIYEPGLAEIVARNVGLGRLLFTSNVTQAILDADIIFIAVGTPTGEDGSADLSAVNAVVKSIAQNCNKHKVIVTKSTVPIGTGKQIKADLLTYGLQTSDFSIVSNPEFLREGSAVQDFLMPDRLVIGTESKDAQATMCMIYHKLIQDQVSCVFTNVVTAESIKYASNAFLATKISFINEVANLCDKTGADVHTVAYAMGLDHRISPQFLKPGPGFGGSCFPKDTLALLYTAKQHNMNMLTVQAALDSNEIQKTVPLQKLLACISTEKLKGKKVAVLGLAFKANTDDIRYSPAIPLIQKLLELGVVVQAYDPAAMNNMKKEFPSVIYCRTMYDAVNEAEAVIIMTEWDEFRQMDLNYVGMLVHNKILIDARNVIDPAQLKQLGFVADGIGQSYLFKCKDFKKIPLFVNGYRNLSLN